MAKKILSAEEIIEAPDLEERELFIPEWKGSIKLKSLTKAAHAEMRRNAVVGDDFDLDLYDIQIFIHGVVEPKFTEDQAQALLEKNAGVIERVNRTIVQISGLTPEALKSAEQFFRRPPEPSE